MTKQNNPSDQHGNADSLSWLPLELDTEWAGETVCLLEQQQLNQLSIKALHNVQETTQILHCQNFAIHVWPNSVSLLPSDLKRLILQTLSQLEYFQ